MAALTNFGGYAEMLYWPAHKLVHVPDTLDPAKAVSLMLNYLVAYQILHRVAKVKSGDKVLIVVAALPTAPLSGSVEHRPELLE